MILNTLSEVGYAALILALGVAIYSAVAALAGRQVPALLVSAYRGVVVVAALVSVAALALWGSLLSHDFGVRYVAETSSFSMDMLSLISAFWGGQAGSLLLWGWLQALITVAVLWRNRTRFPILMPVVTAVLLGVQAFFLFILTMISNPFVRVPLAPGDGQGLNPLLLDAGMRIHPPLLLFGYMSFSVPFAFAVAALVTGDLGRSWLRAIRSWTLLAWAVQGAGLLMGAWWAYHVLGWGGYWGWDPVENVALLPWLAATALLHSIMVQERRGMLKVWNLSLAIGTFALATFGTFVVRSGIITSVHSFALSDIGPYFFGFLAVVLLGAGGLLVYRLPALRAEGRFDSLLSREVGFLANNWLLLAAVAATFWGTIFPLLSEATRGVKVAIGPQFYRQVNAPLFLGLLLLMGIGPLLAWRRTSRGSLVRNFRWPVLAGAVVTVVLVLVLGVELVAAAFAFGACAFVIGAIVLELGRGMAVRTRAGAGPLTAFSELIAANRRRYGGYIVHLGMVVFAIGVIASSFFQQAADFQLQTGQTVTLGRYQLTYNGLGSYRAPGYEAMFARLAVSGAATLQLQPERRVHVNWEQQPVTGVAIGTTLPWMDDIYVLLTGWDDGQGASLRVFINPLITLLWAGGLLFFLGTVVAAWPVAVARVGIPLPAPQPGPVRAPAAAREGSAADA